MTVPTSGGVQTASRFGATMTTNWADAPGFIAQVIANLTAGRGSVGGDSFDPGLSQDEDAFAVEFLPSDSNGNLVFNFAIARVRLRGNTPGAKAKKVRVFFRLFQAQSTISDFNTATTYRFFSDGQLNGVTVPLLGVQNDSNGNPDYVTVPCFATPRVCIDPSADAYKPISMTAQPEDTPNAQEIDVVPGVEVDTFFGCWLDTNQPDQKFLPATLSVGQSGRPVFGRATVAQRGDRQRGTPVSDRGNPRRRHADSAGRHDGEFRQARAAEHRLDRRPQSRHVRVPAQPTSVRDPCYPRRRAGAGRADDLLGQHAARKPGVVLPAGG